MVIQYTPPVDMSVLISELKSHVDHETPERMPECIQTFIHTLVMPLHVAYDKDDIAQDLLVDIIPLRTAQPLSDRLIAIDDRLSNDLDALSLRWHTNTMLSVTQRDNLSKLILLYSDLSIAILDAWKYYDDTLPEHEKYFKDVTM